MRSATPPMRWRARGLSTALSNRNSTSAASVTWTCLLDSEVRTLSSSDAVSYSRSTTGSSMSTTPGASARTTARLASDGDTGERLDVRDDDVDARDRVGRSGERRLQIDGRVLLDERGPEVVAAHAAPGRLTGDEVLLAG